MLLGVIAFYDLCSHLYIVICVCWLDELELRCQTVVDDLQRGTTIGIGQQVLCLWPWIILCWDSAMLLWWLLRILIFSLHGDASNMWPSIIRFLVSSLFLAHFDVWPLLLFIGCNWTHIDRWLQPRLLWFLITLHLLFHSIFGGDAYLGQRMQWTLLRSIQLHAVLIVSIVGLKLGEIRIRCCFLIKQLGMEHCIFGIPAYRVPFVAGMLFCRQMKRRVSQLWLHCPLAWLVQFINLTVGFDLITNFGLCWKWMNWSNRLQHWSPLNYTWFIYLIQVDTSITLHQGRFRFCSEEMCTCTIAYCFAVLLHKRFTSCDGFVWAF